MRSYKVAKMQNGICGTHSSGLHFHHLTRTVTSYHSLCYLYFINFILFQNLKKNLSGNIIIKTLNYTGQENHFSFSINHLKVRKPLDS